jgi:hypothetical protein
MKRVLGSWKKVLVAGVAGMVSVLVLAQAQPRDLSVIVAAPGSATVGTAAAFTVGIGGSSGATGVTVTTVFLPRVTLDSSVPAGLCTANTAIAELSTTVTCAAAGLSSLMIRVVPQSQGTLTAVVGVIGSDPDPIMANNRASAIVSVTLGGTPTPSPTLTGTQTSTRTNTPTATPTPSGPTPTPGSTWTLFGTRTPSVTPSESPKEVGELFKSSQSGAIVALRFWKSPNESGSHRVTVWDSSGVAKRFVDFGVTGGSGWQEATLDPPMFISQGEYYWVSYNVNASAGETPDALGGCPFGIGGIVNGPLITYCGGTAPPFQFPGVSLNWTNYFADIVFQPGAVPSPTSTSTPAATFTATPTFTLTWTASNTPTATQTFTPIRTPTQAFTPSVTPTPTPTPFSVTIFTNQAPAANVTGNSYELGTQFASSQSGNVAALRFWKFSGESGSHTGHLWTDTGTLLASAVFTSESSSGWQEQALANPVAIVPGVNYRVSYNVNGTLGYTADGLSTPISNPPLTGLSSCWSQAGLFPGYRSTNNYFADVRFQPSASQTATPAASATNTPTATPSNTPSSSSTNTPTYSPTATRTASFTNTPTSTPVVTPSATPSNTSTNTPTSTLTATRTSTPNNPPTNTPTQTRTPMPATITLVQKKTAGNQGVTSVSASFSLQPAAGNLLVAIVGVKGTNTINTPTDQNGASNGWLAAINQAGVAIPTRPGQAIFYKIAGTSEPATVKEALTGSNTTMAIQLYEYSGIATSGALDGTSSGNGTGSDPATTGDVTTSAADDLLLAAITIDSADNVTAASNSFTLEQNFVIGSSNGRETFASADRKWSLSSNSTTFTHRNNTWRAQIAAFRKAP